MDEELKVSDSAESQSSSEVSMAFGNNLYNKVKKMKQSQEELK